ncbi:CRISPR-associated protein Csd1 [Virgibacillus natechei]|uniref:CRISPR-associated protein Csd1 n=1 Tax=Virgibacillus natechei TaxID=1216297 RepID=A0ABS4IL03_9BACI|nr:type I-C CRISPR-associated protein Cas8c/Csd1 [Virgibacillus natechei]MBP1971647.1 CRISPR-associated protein Csd1 [Virgibacillus natechei]UZD13865.1 type I-C CRISPR-associated protein Cas8c/Csd1 [Virgibacillus natechei]
MSWMQQLSQVYDHNQSQVGKFEERRKQRMTLLPVSHVMQSAQIEILITPEGEFSNAKVIEKENARTIVPATTASANRSNTSAPHYMHDKLAYVAGDYVKHGGAAKHEEHYNDYSRQMKEWAQSDQTSWKIQAIYSYISKGSVIEDLVNAKILPVDVSNMVFDKWPSREKGEKPDIYKVVTNGALSAFVRFDVMHESPDEPVVWEDSGLFDSFIRFLEKTNEQTKGYCYVTGNYTTLTTQHGSRIRNAGDMAKLISANDSSGYTYRGRFANPTEAVQIGYDVSQQAHHALRWLIQRQGTYVDSRYFVTFGLEQPEVPEPFESTAELFEEDIFSQSLQELGEQQVITEDLVAEELNKALQGMNHTLEKENLENIVVIALDAATKGRLAVVYYQHLKVDLFYKAILHWHTSCRWLQIYQEEETNKIKSYVGTPSTYRMAEAVYGSKADSRIKKELYTRLLPCIIEQKPIPKDIVQIIFNRVKNPFSFNNSNESWGSTLNIACALINKQYEREGYTVALQENNSSRDYLFGRLLGIAEVMERRILKERQDNRATNATRYFNAFSQHPARTWLVIRKQLTPYFERSGNSTGFYAMLLQKIEDRITVEKMTNEPLSPVFLLGYSSQIQDLYTKKEENKNDVIEA